MKIETAPPEWLRAVVEAACVALEINPAMLPTDPHLAGEKVAETITEAIEDVDGDGWPLGATAIDGIPSRNGRRPARAEVAEDLTTTLGDIHSATELANGIADHAADAAEVAKRAGELSTHLENMAEYLNDIIADIEGDKENPK